jgi:hypothetical protein
MKNALRGSIIIALFASAPRVQAETESSRQPKSEGTAVLLSVGGVLGPAAAAYVLPDAVTGGSSRATTVTSLVLLAGGATWGTSLGYFYAGDTRYALVSGLGKTALLGAGIGAGVLAVSSSKGVDDPTGAVFVSLASLAVLVWDVVDVITVPGAVRRHNEHLVALLPTRLGRGWGLALASRF